MDYTTLASADSITKTIAALEANGYHSSVVKTKEEALEKIKGMIPEGVSITNGTSTTLQQIGYVEYLKEGTHGWNNLHAAVLAETDPAKQARLRKESVLADYYLGSVHAVTEEGELVIASASGSQLSSLAYTSQNLILVVSTQKIVPDREEAMNRISTQVLPLEDARMKSTGAAGTLWAKTLILSKEPAFMGRNVQILFVEEQLGF